ncbi:MAG: hypothetical protein U1E33_08460 [Rhodospirillales bacterium]
MLVNLPCASSRSGGSHWNAPRIRRASCSSPHSTPNWQRLFLEALSRFGRACFARWLAAMFQLDEAWALPDALPEMLNAVQQLLSRPGSFGRGSSSSFPT